MPRRKTNPEQAFVRELLYAHVGVIEATAELAQARGFTDRSRARNRLEAAVPRLAELLATLTGEPEPHTE